MLDWLPSNQLPTSTELVHCVNDGNKVLKELGRHVFIDGVKEGELQRYIQHGQTEEGHPGSAIGLLQLTAGGQGTGAVKDPNVVQAEEATREDVLSAGVLTVDPPGEVVCVCGGGGGGGGYVSQSLQRGQTAMVTITVVSAITDEGSRSAVETFD